MFNQNKINLFANCSAIGDMICGLPIIKALFNEDRLNGILTKPDWKDILDLIDIPKDLITYQNEYGLTKYDDRGYIIVPFYPDNRAPYRIHLVDFFSYNAAYACLSPNENSIDINRSKLPVNPCRSDRYIVMQGSTRLKSRTMLPDTWNKIKQYALDNYIDVVVLGSRSDVKTYDFDGCIMDHFGCDLKSSIAICDDSIATVGIDGGLIYIASLSRCPIIAGYSFVDPFYRAPYRAGIKGLNFTAIHPRSLCHYCTNSLCAYGIEFDVACPKNLDFECVKSLHADDFIEALRNIDD